MMKSHQHKGVDEIISVVMDSSPGAIKDPSDDDTTYAHLHNLGMELERREIFSSPLHLWFCCDHPQDFGPTDLMSTYSMCTRRIFGGIGHRTQAFRSGVRCSNH
ncbi:hypothetical protein TNCV_1120351 [Trichonephila clavipes]|uniref:Uncharacterized protein n=1 Tax=Trichonephila clavipes TaxID=2585209 RepID=A0A8X6SWU0_TRICX|nr:hypothetical protein TNCV_1120351 [Trichonephila clavipes]